jgi:flagellar hook-associated protein 3 FlgL
MANIQYGDQYLFGGANNASAPFNTVTNAYAGDSTQLTVEIAQNTSQPISVTGDRLLQGIGTTPSYGAINILDTFDNLITAVGDSITTSDVPGISSASQALQDGSSQINIATSDVLSRMTRLSSMAKLNENNKNTLLTIATNIQNVDYAKLGVELANQKTAFEASLSTAAKLSQLSLLTYL